MLRVGDEHIDASLGPLLVVVQPDEGIFIHLDGDGEVFVFDGHAHRIGSVLVDDKVELCLRGRCTSVDGDFHFLGAGCRRTKSHDG